MKIITIITVRKTVINDELGEDLFDELNKDIPFVDDDTGVLVLEPNPIELNIPSSKEFEEDVEGDEYDIFGLLLNIHELLFFPKLKKREKINNHQM
uniref:Uncharacterized protein n=1 Tax=viral metagenome TaxID=1070528 RepID=A0A6C0DF93_9ZZZZ